MKKIVSFALAVAISFVFLTVTVTASSSSFSQKQLKTYFELSYSSVNDVSFFADRWASPTVSYLDGRKNGSFFIVEAQYINDGGYVRTERYSSSGKLTGKKNIKQELPYFGGLFIGEKYNYILFGQLNSENSDEKEVFRIVKYSKNYNKISSTSVTDCYTTIPFDAGSASFAENGNELSIHTCRKRYDGHQSNLTIIVDTSSMTVTNKSDLSEFPPNHVSHSFNQFVRYDDGVRVMVDHGDAYPRCVSLQKEFPEISSYFRYFGQPLFAIPGNIGANFTGVSVGGFEISSSDYIVAINSVDHSLITEYTNFQGVGLTDEKMYQRDIIICSAPKIISGDQPVDVSQTTVMKYVGTRKFGSIPKLVKISDEKFMLLWQEFDLNYNPISLRYAYLNAAGKVIGKVNGISGYYLSTVQPVVCGGKVMWHVNRNDSDYSANIKRRIYSINIEK